MVGWCCWGYAQQPELYPTVGMTTVARPKSIESAGLQQAIFCVATDCSKRVVTAEVPALVLAAV